MRGGYGKMTDKERLEIIKMDNERYHQEVVFSSQVLSDIKWLIKQAERVEELEMKLSINTNNMKQLQKRIEELELEVNDWREEVQKWQKFYKESEESHLETKELLRSTISENQRYKQFIEHFAYCDEDYEGMLRLQNKAKKLNAADK